MARSQLGEIKTDLQEDSGSALWSLIQGEQLEFPVTLSFLTNTYGGYSYEAVLMEGSNVSGSDAAPLEPRTPKLGSHTTWSAGVHSAGDYVEYTTNIFYKCILAATGSDTVTPNLDTIHWIRCGASDTLTVRVPPDRGAWVSGATYVATTSYVTYGGQIYQCNSGTSDTVIPPSNNKWTLVPLNASVNTWTAATSYNREDVVLYSGVYYKLAKGTNRVNATNPSLDSQWELYTPNKVYIQFPSTLTITHPWMVLPTNNSSVYGFLELSVQEPAGGVYQRTWKPLRGVVEFLYSPTLLV